MAFVSELTLHNFNDGNGEVPARVQAETWIASTAHADASVSFHGPSEVFGQAMVLDGATITSGSRIGGRTVIAGADVQLPGMTIMSGRIDQRYIQYSTEYFEAVESLIEDRVILLYSGPASYDFRDGKGPVPAHHHKNPDGSVRGWIAYTAHLDSTVDIQSPVDTVMVFGHALILGQTVLCSGSRIGGRAVIAGDVVLSWHYIVSGRLDQQYETQYDIADGYWRCRFGGIIADPDEETAILVF